MSDPADPRGARPEPARQITGISAITLATHDMARSVRFYELLGFSVHFRSADATLTSLKVGPNYLNLLTASAEQHWSWWGRVIIYVADVDALYRCAVTAGLRPDTVPADAPWGERYFHLTDPEGHQLSFARPLTIPPAR